ncbi:CAP domain-containing protein [Isoptericola sp. AK164]|uniref:CAP domain-containing protein n=1 Tax=Isoptericola sp. AK164 TaxID=3024246 RepID=UPI0024182E67|nr:CAP domain-containing protein [Isoptericola sp. AK164]
MTSPRRASTWWRQLAALAAAFAVGLGLLALLVLLVPDGLRVAPHHAASGAATGAPAAAPADVPALGTALSATSPVASTPSAATESPEQGIVVDGERSRTDADRAIEVQPAAPSSSAQDEAPRDTGPTPADRPDDGSGDGPDDGAAGGSGTRSAVADRVLELVNVERAGAGCSALVADPALDGLAAAHSEDMRSRDYFDHTDPDGRTPWDRADAAGVSGLAAENIARGQPDAAAVVEAWMDSPGHRANILECSHTRHGLGTVAGAGGPWWTQLFGR